MRTVSLALAILFAALQAAGSIEGVVQTVMEMPDGGTRLRLGQKGGWVDVEFPSELNIRSYRFLDSRLWLRGTVQNHCLVVKSPADYEVLGRLHPEDDVCLTARDIRINGLKHLNPARRRFSGRVLFASDDGLQFMVEDSNGESLEVWTETAADCGVGDSVEGVGYLEVLSGGRAVLRIAHDGRFGCVARAPGEFGRIALVLIVCLAVLAIAAAGVSLWIAFLRRVIARQTERLLETSREKIRIQVEADAVLRERMRLASDLHDGFQQLLAGAMFRLDACLGKLGEGAARHELEGARQTLDHAQNDLRSMLWMISSEAEDARSLSNVFRHAVAKLPHW